MRDLVKEIAGGTTVLFSTHTIPWVEQTCKRAIVINRGKIVADGTIADLKQVVAPWARVEFRCSLAPERAAEVVGGVPGVLFVENLTTAGETRLRVLAEQSGVDAVIRGIGTAVGGAGGKVDGIVTAPAEFDDLFTRLTRGEAVQEAA